MRSSHAPGGRPSTGIVLSGGGARGAYEVGVVQGLMEVLQPEYAPFDVLCGTSVGALNVAYLAAHAEQPDMAIGELSRHWCELEITRHLRLDLRGVLGWKRQFSEEEPQALPRLVGHSLLDSRALEAIVLEHIPWAALRDNVQAQRVRALIVSALHIASGNTTLFAELAAGVDLVASRDARRVVRKGPVQADQVLASAAIPLLFPARRVGSDYYCDGGLRFNTPIAPAIRAGAERLVVVSLLSEEQAAEADTVLSERVHAYNSPVYLIGKLLNALLLDPLRYDLQVLDRFNRLMEALDRALPPEELAEVQAVIERARGLPYRRVRTLVFRPSRDVGHLARERVGDLEAPRFSSWLLARTASLGSFWESDLLSFILFDGEFAQVLIELGRNDVHARADEVRAFFGKPEREGGHDSFGLGG